MKTINVKVIPNAKRNEVSEEQGMLRVHVRAPAVGGKANKAVIEVLADFFGVRKSDITIIKGEKTRKKLIGIMQKVR